MIKYYRINNYTVKCRLYPNKEQAEQIDNLIDAARLFHNNVLYDMIFNKNPEILNEKKSEDKPKEETKKKSEKKSSKKKKDKTNNTVDKAQNDKANLTITADSTGNAISVDGNNVINNNEFVHFPNFSAMKKASYINKLKAADPRIDRLPGAAISGQSVGIIEDMKKAWEKTGKYPIEKFGNSYFDEDGNEIEIGIRYYNSKRKRKSYTYQTSLSNIIFTDNQKVIKIKLSSRNYPVTGQIKVKGFNNKLRFDESCEMTFKDWVETYNKLIRIIVSKDNCNDYYISFMLPYAYKPIKENEHKSDITGVDVGEIDNMVTYDGIQSLKFGNVISTNKRLEHEEDGLVLFGERLARRQGWSNESFRTEHKSNKGLKPSKSYEKTKKRKNEIDRKITRQRRDFQSKAVMSLIGSTNAISIEGLRVKDLYERKPKDKQTEKKTQQKSK